MYTPIGTYIRERRQDLGFSQEHLADRVGGGYGQSDVSRLERGQIELPRLGTVLRLASALEVPVGDLLIASGWFTEGHFTPIPASSGAVDQDALVTVLGDIEAELEAIRHLERQAQSRSDRLRTMIRELKATSGLSVTMTAQEQHAFLA